MLHFLAAGASYAGFRSIQRHEFLLEFTEPIHTPGVERDNVWVKCQGPKNTTQQQRPESNTSIIRPMRYLRSNHAVLKYSRTPITCKQPPIKRPPPFKRPVTKVPKLLSV